MGYTHYWRQPWQALAPEKWALIVSDVKKILATTDVPLLREYDEPGTKPEITTDLIRFNGVADEGHETFYFERTPGEDVDYQKQQPKHYVKAFSFCKTAHKPYDVVVCACLIIIRHHAPKVDMSSDGDYPDWAAGHALVLEATGQNCLVLLD